MTLSVLPVEGIPEVRPGDDLAALILAGVTRADGPGLRDGDILVVTSKVVSKAEGRLVRGRDRDEVIDAETHRVVAEWTGPGGRTVIAQTRHGLVLAAAGVDASNVEPGILVVLPEDPDGSAARLRAHMHRQAGVNVGVVVSDTMGRPWREGQTDTAIGAAGLLPLRDLRGSMDTHGTRLVASQQAVADEMASAAELASGKTSGIPAVVIRGLHDLVLAPGEDGPGARTIVRPARGDRFALGTAEAGRAAITSRRTVRKFTDEPVPRAVVLRAVEAAVTAPAPHHERPWRFVLVESAATRARLLDAMREVWLADLRADGMGEQAAARRSRRGDVLRQAPALVVPCLAGDGRHAYPDPRRAQAEATMFWLAMGAGVQNVLLSIAADGWGSAWVSASLFCPTTVRQVLDLPDSWEPAGCLAIGRPARQPSARTPRSTDDIWTVR